MSSTAIDTPEVLSHGELVRIPRPGGRLTVAELKQEAEEVRELVRAVLIEGSDYGQIPGTQKPTLFKSGAETLLRRFGFGHRMDKIEIDRDSEDRHYGATYRCTVHVITDPDMVLSTCDGYCGYDEPDREEHTNKWGKAVPRAPWNTIIKMAQKRALIGATLQATATSGLFTQDLEDMGNAAASDDDQRDWYEQNGWTDQEEHDRARATLMEKLGALPNDIGKAFVEWRKKAGIELRNNKNQLLALTKEEFDKLHEHYSEVAATSPEAGDEPGPEAAGQQDAAPEGAAAQQEGDATAQAGGVQLSKAELDTLADEVKAMSPTAVDAELRALELSTDGAIKDRRQRLAKARVQALMEPPE